ncbi:MAG TPA: hypothetical protein VG738_06930 [Chitinophagaceae bacterium]|nr:hypothetical protein [Chitinophagaceae bacterium]
MNITFKHVRGGNVVTVAATVIYNIEQVTDMFIVLPKSYTHELGDIITFFRTVNNYWWSDTLVRMLHPESFRNLLAKLIIVFKDFGFKFLEDAPDD